MHTTKPQGAPTAIRWFRNGDHPDDYKGQPEKAKLLDWEGRVVRRYRSSSCDGMFCCQTCRKPMNDHGFIDNDAAGMTVCPGDWVVTNLDGSFAVVTNEAYQTS